MCPLGIVLVSPEKETASPAKPANCIWSANEDWQPNPVRRAAQTPRVFERVFIDISSRLYYRNPI